MNLRFDAIVIGAGAAGLMCAIEAGKRGRRVAVLEHQDRPGKKILISGGGRCNFTNLNCRPENFLSSNPHFPKSALARYTPADFVDLVRRHQIAYHEKAAGQLFCDDSARQITDMLDRECRDAGVRVCVSTRVQEIRKTDGFLISTSSGVFEAPALVVATGGLSIPKMGATGFGYDIARQFGHGIVEPRPALVPFVFDRNDGQRYDGMAGVATDIAAALGKKRFQDRMLFTHKGLSGPAILQISSYWKPGEAISIDLAPGRDGTEALRQSPSGRDRETLRGSLRTILPNRLADRWIELNAPAGWTNRDLAEFERKLHSWEFVPAGTEGYPKAEVTAGGVDTDDLSAKTMESRRVPGLYFIGEVVDVTGQLGGFNFQWAWASGYCAGQAI